MRRSHHNSRTGLMMVNVRLAISLHVALTILIFGGCSDGTSRAPQATPRVRVTDESMPASFAEATVTDGSMTASFAEAEALLGFEIVTPAYLPDGMEPAGQVHVIVSDGKPVQAALVYFTPEHLTMGIDQSMGPPPANFGLGDAVNVKGATVYVRTREDGVVTEWTDDGLLFYLTVFALSDGEVDSGKLGEEALRVIASMID